MQKAVANLLSVVVFAGLAGAAANDSSSAAGSERYLVVLKGTQDATDSRRQEPARR